jgi:hypothetical protein
LASSFASYPHKPDEGLCVPDCWKSLHGSSKLQLQETEDQSAACQSHSVNQTANHELSYRVVCMKDMHFHITSYRHQFVQVVTDNITIKHNCIYFITEFC